MLMNQSHPRFVGFTWNQVYPSSCGISRYSEAAWQGDEREAKPQQSLVFWLKSSLEENKKSGFQEGSLSQKQVRCEGEQHCVWERHKHLFVQSSVVGKSEDPDTIPGSQRKEGLLPAVIVSFSN